MELRLKASQLINTYSFSDVGKNTSNKNIPVLLFSKVVTKFRTAMSLVNNHFSLNFTKYTTPPTATIATRAIVMNREYLT